MRFRLISSCGKILFHLFLSVYVRMCLPLWSYYHYKYRLAFEVFFAHNFFSVSPYLFFANAKSRRVSFGRRRRSKHLLADGVKKVHNNTLNLIRTRSHAKIIIIKKSERENLRLFFLHIFISVLSLLYLWHSHHPRCRRFADVCFRFQYYAILFICVCCACVLFAPIFFFSRVRIAFLEYALRYAFTHI